jgi:hypothetical protein
MFRLSRSLFGDFDDLAERVCHEKGDSSVNRVDALLSFKPVHRQVDPVGETALLQMVDRIDAELFLHVFVDFKERNGPYAAVAQDE